MDDGPELTDKDLNQALKELGSYVDITIDDLLKIYSLARNYARQRIATSILVGAIMRRAVVSVLQTDTVETVTRILTENNVSGLPVINDEKVVVGVVSEADILGTMDIKREVTLVDRVKGLITRRWRGGQRGIKVENIMSKPPITIRPEADMREAATLLTEKGIKRLPVVDAENRLVGIISRADIVRAAQKR